MDAVMTYIGAACLIYMSWSYSITQMDMWIDSGFKLSEFLLFVMGAAPAAAGVVVLLFALSKHTALAEPIAWLTGIEYHEPSNNKCD